jgi:hypothetical protein
MEQQTLLLQISIVPPVVKESSIFTHELNFDGREAAAGATMISTTRS